MSRATAEFFKPDGSRIGYGLYDGTVDSMFPWIVDTIEQAWAVYYPNDAVPPPKQTMEEWWEICRRCSHEPQECIAVSHYGSVFYWPGLYCQTCSIFLGPMSPYSEGVFQKHGHPFPTAKDAVVETVVVPEKMED